MTSSLNIDSIKPHLLPIIATLVVVATVPLAIMPWSTQILEDYEEVSDKSVLRDKLVVKANELEAFDVSNSRDLLQNIVEPALPSEADAPSALAVVELAARQAETRILGISYGQTSNRRMSKSQRAAANAKAQEAAAGSSTVDATVTLSGGYENLVSFIRQSETVSRVISIETLQLSKVDETVPEVTATFSISAPYLAHPSDLGPIETPFPQLTAKETRVIDLIKTYNKSSYSPTNVDDITGKTNPF